MTLQYLQAARTILNEGTRKPNRTGVDTISTFAVPMRFDLRDGFPLLTTKEIKWEHIVLENLWFLSGERHIGFLKKHGVKFWDKWADENGCVPSAYGNFWRNFPVPGLASKDTAGFCDPPIYNDQIDWVVNALRKDPTNRRLVVNAWAPGNAQTSKLPPCHVMFVLNTQNLPTQPQSIVGEEDRKARQLLNTAAWAPRNDGIETDPHLCLHLTQRSCDMFLGVPYNIAGYAFILSVIAHLTGLKPGIFSHMLVDAHFYTRKPDGSMASGGTHGEDDSKLLDHIPMITEQLTREPRMLPQFTISDKIKSLDDIKVLLEAPKDEILDIFKLENYNPHGSIKGKVAV